MGCRLWGRTESDVTFRSSSSSSSLCCQISQKAPGHQTLFGSDQLYFFKLIYNFGCTGSVFFAACWLPLVEVSGGYSLAPGHELLAVVAFLVAEHRLEVPAGFSACSTWASGLAAPRHVGSFPTRDRTCVPHIGRWILNYWTMREAPGSASLILHKCPPLHILSPGCSYCQADVFPPGL